MCVIIFANVFDVNLSNKRLLNLNLNLVVENYLSKSFIKFTKKMYSLIYRDLQNSRLIWFFILILLRNYSNFFPQHVEEQVMTSKENMALNFINNKSFKNVSGANGNGG